MNAAQVHLALTHLPVVLSLTGLAILVVSLFIKNPIVTTIAFYVLLVAGLFTIPVFLSGEGAEEIVENLPGVSEPLIEEHEDFANLTLYAIIAAAAGSLFGLFRLTPAIKKVVYYFVLVAALATTGMMAQTAHLGGQIRHSEIRQGNIAGQDNGEMNSNASEKDDDD